MIMAVCMRCGNPLNARIPERDEYLEVKTKWFGEWAHPHLVGNWHLCGECGNNLLEFLKEKGEKEVK